MKVLIAEDEPVQSRILQHLLTRMGHDVVTTQDGAEAWETLQQGEPPDLVILDWIMPRLEGPEVCRRIRASPRLRSLYVILLTVQSEPEYAVEAQAAGADEYRGKPFDLPTLEARLREIAEMLARRRID